MPFLTPLVRIVFGTWAIIAIYAVLHDQFIVSFAPEHFTKGHPPVPGIDEPHLQAAVLAFGASIAPGFAFGLGLAIVSDPPDRRTTLRRSVVPRLGRAAH